MTNIDYAKRFIEKALTLQGNHANETKVRDNFTSYLRNMFPDNPKWVNYHIEGAETHVHLVRKGKQISGFIDNCIDSIAIEYEKNLTIQSVFDEGYRQVKEYCAALIREGIQHEMILGILSDTLHWRVYEVEQIPGLNRQSYNQDNIRLKEIASINVESTDTRTVEDFLRFLTTYLGRQGGRCITAKRLADDFGLRSEYSEKYRIIVSEYVRNKIATNPEYYQMVKHLWNRLVENHTNSDNNIESYINEFYISILAKLLCANLISLKALSSNDCQLVQIINGKFFQNRNIENFVDYDYFGWLNDDVKPLLDILKMIQDDLKIYDFNNTPEEDLFGELMVQLATKTQRILLGQELTPRWLAKELVENVANTLPEQTYPQFVDMCCGSGSMIVETIRVTYNKVLNNVSTDRDSIIKNCISGFDIDPLAVVLAKINWLINIYNLVDHSSPLFIPIYHANSLFTENPITKRISNGKGKILKLELLDKHVDIPEYAISADFNNTFDLIVNKCYDFIHVHVDKNTFKAIILDLLDNEIEDEKKQELCKFAYELYSALYKLTEEEKNGIWAFILKNSFRPCLISAKFNGIVSNTPWLAMSKISSSPYKVALKSIAKKLGINPTDSSFPHLEMATVFLLSSIHRYLQYNGCFGCILPDSVMTGAQHSKFRTGKFTQRKILADFNEIWELPLDTFKNRSIAIFGKKQKFISKESYKGRKYSSKNTFEDVTFSVSKATSKQVWTSEATQEGCVVEENQYSFRQGADIMPRCFFFFDIKDNGTTVNISPITQNCKYSYFLKDMKVGKNLIFNSCGISKSFVKNVLISNILLPFVMSELPFAVLPIEKTDSEWKELEETKLLASNRSVINHFNHVKEAYTQIKNKADLYANTLNMRNKLELQNIEKGQYLVVYGAGGANICSAYMLIDDSSQYIVDQTLYWTTVATENEAIYLSSMLNCPSLTEIISAYQPQGIFGKRHVHTLPLNYIPKYSDSNINHQSVVYYGKKLHSELLSVLPPELADPNAGALSSRRKKVTAILRNLPYYTNYLQKCESVLKSQFIL